MFLRIDKLPVELPASPDVDPIAAKKGGHFAEVSAQQFLDIATFFLDLLPHSSDPPASSPVVAEVRKSPGAMSTIRLK